MIVYRLTKLRYAQDLSGYGASLSTTNRWNSKGKSMLYTANNRALAFAEVYVHLRLQRIPDDLMMVELRLPKSITAIEAKVNKDMRSYRIRETQEIGDAFLKNTFQFALKAPSIVVPGEFNILLDPAHEMADEIIIEDVRPFQFDSRFMH